MAGTTQKNTPEVEPPEWLLTNKRDKEFWAGLSQKHRNRIARNAEWIREEYGVSDPQMIFGMLLSGV